MPLFSYTAAAEGGRAISGRESARNKRELARQLRKQGYVLTSAEVLGKNGERWWDRVSFGFFGGASLTDKLVFTRNLRVMVGAGIGLPRALSILAEQTESKPLGKALKQMQEEITKGDTFSSALAKRPALFSELFQAMIKVGEESGTLEEVLAQLELQLERSHDLHSKIQGALMYPAVVVTAMIGIGVLMLIVVVPELAKTFEDLGVQLPFTTRLIIGFGSFLTHLWYVALAGTLAFLLLLRFAVSTLWGKRLIDSFSLRAPLISGIVHKMNSAIIVRTLSSLIAAGVPLLQALDITSHTVKNRSFQESLEYAGEQVKKGARLSEALEPYGKLYPSLVIQMVKVGEETGQTSDILAKLASFFEEEVTNATKNLASIIEPVLMLIVGAVVGFFAISMVQPMYSILGGIK